MHSRRNSPVQKEFLYSSAVFYLYRILGIDTAVSGRQIRCDDTVLQQLCIAGADAATGAELFIKNREFRQQDCRLKRVTATIDTDYRVVIATILAMGYNLSHSRGKFIIAGKTGPSVAVTAQRL